MLEARCALPSGNVLSRGTTSEHPTFLFRQCVTHNLHRVEVCVDFAAPWRSGRRASETQRDETGDAMKAEHFRISRRHSIAGLSVLGLGGLLLPAAHAQ